MTKKDDLGFFMGSALQQAQCAYSKKEVPVGAVIVKNNKIISKGYNLKENKNNPLGHAELIAIKKASTKIKNWRLNECDVYVTLEPCVMCMSAFYQARVRRVYFAAYDKKAGALSLGYEINKDKRLNHNFDISYTPFVQSEELLKNFFKELRKK